MGVGGFFTSRKIMESPPLHLREARSFMNVEIHLLNRKWEIRSTTENLQ